MGGEGGRREGEGGRGGERGKVGGEERGGRWEGRREG